MRYELIDCARRGHELVGTDAATVRAEDHVLAREDPAHGVRWHRCLRCDAWIPREPPRAPARQHPPHRDQIELPLRGRTLRDRYVLRLFALDKFLHFLVLTALGVGILLFASHRGAVLHSHLYRVLTDIQGATGGPTNNPSPHGFLRELRKVLSLRQGTLDGIGAAAIAYGLLEGAEGIGLWLQKRWGEYLTFVATGIFVPFEVYELTHKLSVFKVLALVINLAIVVWLLLNKRLFGLRGGGKAERAEREREAGWAALEAATPGVSPAR